VSETRWTLPLSTQSDPAGESVAIVDAAGRTVVWDAATEEDAREIVRRCNAHDGLVTGINDLMCELFNLYDRTNPASRWIVESVKRLRSLAHQATGEPS
jgi:hypothetical protein